LGAAMSWQCVVCGIQAIVTVRTPGAVLGYCSTDWLAVVLDELPPGTAVVWAQDEPPMAQGRPRLLCLGRRRGP
jgi:hypothetical protein